MKKLSQFRGLDEGSTEVWYQKDMRTLDHFDPDIDPDNLEATHILMGTINADDEDDAFMMMQGENWSPRGEAYTFVQEKGVRHTSMMVNDIVVVDGKKMLCQPMGWKEL